MTRYPPAARPQRSPEGRLNGGGTPPTVVWGLLVAFTDSATSCFANCREYVSGRCDAFELVDAPVLIGDT
jgi:hypothetical protein